jgi:hypothetical protein
VAITHQPIIASIPICRSSCSENCALALKERPASCDGLGVRAFHYPSLHGIDVHEE